MLVRVEPGALTGLAGRLHAVRAELAHEARASYVGGDLGDPAVVGAVTEFVSRHGRVRRQLVADLDSAARALVGTAEAFSSADQGLAGRLASGH